MIFLEQTVNQILREEGQTIISLKSLQITWEDLEKLFIGVFEQAKQYISIYDWVNDNFSTSQSKRPEYAHVRHITYNPALYMQRLMPDLPGSFWEFNQYTKNASSLYNANFSLEVAIYPTLENLTYITNLTAKSEKTIRFSTPCSFNASDFSFSDFIAYPKNNDEDTFILESDHGVGSFDCKTLTGQITVDEDYTGDLTVVSKYVGIKELDLSCELFYIWFKGALMQYIGAMKKQLGLTGVGLPFDINADGLLERGRQLLDRVEDLKGTKSHWSNF